MHEIDNFCVTKIKHIMYNVQDYIFFYNDADRPVIYIWARRLSQRLTEGRRLSPGTPVSSTNKTDHHDIAEILLKVTLNTITKPSQTKTGGMKKIIAWGVYYK
jgi:hypothetical protein